MKDSCFKPGEAELKEVSGQLPWQQRLLRARILAEQLLSECVLNRIAGECGHERSFPVCSAHTDGFLGLFPQQRSWSKGYRQRSPSRRCGLLLPSPAVLGVEGRCFG